jgi:hypothetical protein
MSSSIVRSSLPAGAAAMTAVPRMIDVMQRQRKKLFFIAAG